jgi:hypothetical protein
MPPRGVGLEQSGDWVIFEGLSFHQMGKQD